MGAEMSEKDPVGIEPEPMIEPYPINKDLLLTDPVKYGNLLYGALNIPMSKNFQIESQNDEVRALCGFCSQFNDFIEVAFDVLVLKKGRPGRASTLWDVVSKEDYSQVPLIARGPSAEEFAELKKEQKTRQRAIAHLYVLDELAIALINKIIEQDEPTRQKSA